MAVEASSSQVRSAQDELKVAIVGVGRNAQGWGGRGHVPALRMTPGVRLVAVCTDHEDSARDAADAIGVDRWYSSVDQVAEADDIDLVTVATRARFHLQLVRPLLRARKMVYCEWPLGLNVLDAVEMTAWARAAGVLTAIGTQARHAPASQQVRSLLDAGEFGRPLMFHATEFMPRPVLRSDQWWVHTKADDASVHGVLTAHLTALVQFLLGPVASVSGQVQTLLPDDSYADTGDPFRWTTSDSVSYQAVLASGTTGVVHLSGAVAGASGFCLDIFCEGGQYQLRSPLYSGLGPLSVTRLRAGATEPEEVASDPTSDFGLLGPQSVSHAYGAIRDAWRSNQPYHPSFEDALQLHRVIAAIEESWDKRGWVDL